MGEGYQRRKGPYLKKVPSVGGNLRPFREISPVEGKGPKETPGWHLNGRSGLPSHELQRWVGTLQRARARLTTYLLCRVGSSARARGMSCLRATRTRRTRRARQGEDIDCRPDGQVRARDRALDDEVRSRPVPPAHGPWVPVKTGELFGVWHNMTRDLAAACVRAGIERVTANDLRRSNATLLRRAGASVDVIARVLRHADSRMVERVYGRITAADAGRLLTTQLAVGEPSSLSTIDVQGEETDGVQGRNRTGDTRIFNPVAEHADQAVPAGFLGDGSDAGTQGKARPGYSASTPLTYPRGVPVSSLTPLHLALALASVQRRADLRALEGSRS